VELLRDKLLDGDQVSFDDIQAWNMITVKPGLHEWSGRFWLPAGDRVEPTRKYCLIREDGQAGEMIFDRFGSSDIDGHVAAFQGNRRFA